MKKQEEYVEICGGVVAEPYDKAASNGKADKKGK